MLITNLAILVLAGFVGFAVISKVPNTLHTPLMSGTNAIHGIVVLAGLLVVGFSGNDIFNKVILVIAVAFGTINVVGGFLVTDRMLGMFKRKPEPRPEPEDEPEPKRPGEPMEAPTAAVDEPEPEPEPANPDPSSDHKAAGDAEDAPAGEPGEAAANRQPSSDPGAAADPGAPQKDPIGDPPPGEPGGPKPRADP